MILHLLIALVQIFKEMIIDLMDDLLNAGAHVTGACWLYTYYHAVVVTQKHLWSPYSCKRLVYDGVSCTRLRNYRQAHPYRKVAVVFTACPCNDCSKHRDNGDKIC